MSPLRWLPLFLFVSCVSLSACGKSDAPAGPGAGANQGTPGAPGGDKRELSLQAAAPTLMRLAASAAPSASESAAPAPVDAKVALLGTWKFSGFDLSDPGTKSFWTGMAGVAQGELLSEASKATLIITPAELVTRVAGDQLRVPYTVEAIDAGAASDELVLKTKDGRKGVRFTDAKRGVIRVVELESPKAPVAFFARMPPAAPAVASGAPASAPASASGSAKK
jgi:hypothetical protein